jgi:hypothetical protein
MYRIELSPGEETVFRSIEELAVAIKRGVITPRARIYHNASNKWLPIQFHPHYKAAVSMPLTQAALVAGPPVKPLVSLSLEHPADPSPAARVVPEPVIRTAPSAVERPARKKRSRSEQPSAERQARRRSTKSRRQLRIALVGALLIGGAQWVLSEPLFYRADAPALLRTQRRLIAAQAEAMQRVGSANTAAMFPVLPRPPATSQLETVPRSGAEPPPLVTGPHLGVLTPPVETAATDIEPAPSVIEVRAPALPVADSLTSKMKDSTDKKALKGILRAVSGAPAKEKSPARH